MEGRKIMTLDFTADILFYRPGTLLYGHILAALLMKYFNLLCENVFLLILLSAPLTCSQKANFHVYPRLSMDNKVFYVLFTSYGFHAKNGRKTCHSSLRSTTHHL